MSKGPFSKIFVKNIIRFFIPVYFLLIGGIILFTSIEILSQIDEYKLVQENLLKENSMLIKNTLDNIYSDLCFMSELPEISEYYYNPEHSASVLENIFSSFVNNKKIYMQIRLLDSLGKETIRVDYKSDIITITRGSDLQNKSNRYYFKQLKKMREDQFYISEFDLNIEKGKIDYPISPVIRFGKTHFDTIRNQNLYLVLNFSGNNILKDIKESPDNQFTKCYLLNDKGYYLVGPKVEYEWQFQLASSGHVTFKKHYPREWGGIKNSVSHGHIKSKNGRFTFLKIDICEHFSSNNFLTNQITPFPCQSWLLVSHTSRKNFNQYIIAPIIKKYSIITFLTGILVFFGVRIYTLFRIQQLGERERRQLHYQFLNSLIETIPNPIFYIDHINNEFGCNEGFEVLTGRNRKELKNMKIEKLFDKPNQQKKVQKLGTKTVKVTETKLRYPDGKIHNHLYYKAPIISKGNNIGLVGVFTDITSIRETEEALRKSEHQLRQANKTKDRFFSLIAHDLKNPFHAVMGLAHLLKTNFNSISDEDKISIADNILHSTDNTFQLLINLLEWARLQEGKIHFKKEILNLSELIVHNIELMQAKFTEKELTVTHDVSYDLTAAGDKNMVNTILRNLISNAIKFTEVGGRIHIAARETFKFVEVSVTDTGIGINPEDLKTLFRIDKRSAVTDTEGSQGTGLGLVLCKEFVEMNKGSIWAESKVGKGSVFYFSLPLE
ncbi:MAG: PAS domain S-box protein [Bacteroidales bacterium]|nr:PAS domain S-box protein [Bacteroidales bacterium]